MRVRLRGEMDILLLDEMCACVFEREILPLLRVEKGRRCIHTFEHWASFSLPFRSLLFFLLSPKYPSSPTRPHTPSLHAPSLTNPSNPPFTIPTASTTVITTAKRTTHLSLSFLSHSGYVLIKCASVRISTGKQTGR